LQRIPPFRALDALRGFAAAWVVMVHCCDRFLGGDNLRYQHSPLYEFAIYGQLGVVFFFVISGYCITAAAHGALYSGKTLRRYAFERGRRIFPPYWIAFVVGTLAQLFLRLAESHNWIAKINHVQPMPSPLSLYWLANASLTQYEFGTGFANIVFWSLCYEVAFYAVIGVLLIAAQRVAKGRGMAAGQLTLILGLALTTFATLLTLILFGGAVFPFDLWHLFGFGGLLFYLLESKRETVAGYSSRLRLILSGIAAISVLLALVYVIPRNGESLNLGPGSVKLNTIVCLIFCFCLVGLRRFDAHIEDIRWLRPLFWLGAGSYSLYLIHPVVLPFIDVAGRKAGLDHGLYWINFWIQFAVAVVVGRILYLLVERHFIYSRQTKRQVEEHVAQPVAS
jgi:exopolysaccharide production protein ExoZ